MTLADEVHTKILLIRGAPKLLRGKLLSPITNDTLLIDGDIIRTGKKDLIILKSQASTYKVSPMSFIKLDLREKELINSELAWGTVVINFTKSAIKNHKSKALKIKTKSASLAVRGTKLFTFVEKNGETTTSVEHGHVDSYEKNNDQATTIRDGQSVMLSSTKRSSKVKKLGFEKYINWSLDKTSESLDHPTELFDSIRQQWENYKKESQKSWDSYKEGMNKKWK